MKAIIQRVSSASVTIDGILYSRIDNGLLILLGIKNGDTAEEAKYVAEKCAAVRIFEDADEKMNLSVNDANGKVMIVSQFTIYGDTRKGNRPSFIEAAPPQLAEPIYDQFVEYMRMLLGKDRVSTGVFRAMMEVALINDGPVTVIVESKS
ncbi:MAG: D-aminoacyl-tRNA deacylase [Bacteriovoracaceae bacterium]|nr:D-aminoacyl-tRNA deacylase [Bacteroidota bacterium]